MNTARPYKICSESRYPVCMSLQPSTPQSRQTQKPPKPRPVYIGNKGLTILEVMVAMFLMATFMLGFLDTFLQSRRTTEETVMQSAATAMVYGLIEQMKGLNYSSGLPITATDSEQALYDAFPGSTSKTVPYIRMRLNQDQVTWLQCVYNTDSSTYAAPTTTPTSIASLDSTMRNTIGPLKLSNVSGATSQPLQLYVWVWVDTIANSSSDVSDAKAVTLVYAYQVSTGRGTKTIIKRETFVTTLFGSMYQTT